MASIEAENLRKAILELFAEYLEEKNSSDIYNVSFGGFIYWMKQHETTDRS